MKQGLKVRDLGTLKGDVLVFGGPYSNLQATQALYARAHDLGISATHCICTGDVVAYCADPAATVGAVRGFGGPVVAGNCERQLAAQAADCGCGFETGTTCDLLSAGWYGHADRSIDQKARDWMRRLPDLMVFRHQGRRCAVIHGGVSDISRFLWPTSTDAEFETEIAALRAVAGSLDCVLAGHCGLAFARRINDVTWINAGAIGMPPHDGRPETRFAMLTGTGVVFHRLSYDHKGAGAAMAGVGLVEGYQNALTTGIWPSEDALPVELRR